MFFSDPQPQTRGGHSPRAVPSSPSDWICPLLHDASIGLKQTEAKFWADSTGCLERDLLEDDEAVADLCQSLRLKKFEKKRLWRLVSQRRVAAGLPATGIVDVAADAVPKARCKVSSWVACAAAVRAMDFAIFCVLVEALPQSLLWRSVRVYLASLADLPYLFLAHAAAWAHGVTPWVLDMGVKFGHFAFQGSANFLKYPAWAFQAVITAVSDAIGWWHWHWWTREDASLFVEAGYSYTAFFSLRGLALAVVLLLSIGGFCKVVRRAVRPHNRVCAICMASPAEATFVHNGTGHTCACMGCALVVMQRKGSCPMCRLPIESVIHNFN